MDTRGSWSGTDVRPLANVKSVHVIPRGDKWVVKRRGSRRADSRHDTQKEAEKRGRTLARRLGVVFVRHDKTGAPVERDDYRKVEA